MPIEAKYKPKPTPRMIEVFEYAAKQIKETGFMPTQLEIALELEMSQCSVSNILRRMIEKGFAERLEGTGRRCEGYRFHPTRMGLQEMNDE